MLSWCPSKHQIFMMAMMSMSIKWTPLHFPSHQLLIHKRYLNHAITNILFVTPSLLSVKMWKAPYSYIEYPIINVMSLIGSFDPFNLALLQPSRTFSSSSTCCICLNGYVEGITLTKLQCNHEFHKSCVDEWFKINPTCPLCKHESVAQFQLPYSTHRVPLDSMDKLTLSTQHWVSFDPLYVLIHLHRNKAYFILVY